MANFEVTLSNLRSSAISEERLANELNKLENMVYDICNNLSFKVAAERNIKQRLRNSANNIDGYRKGMTSLSQGLNSSIDLYRKTENRVIIKANGKQGSIKDIKSVVGAVSATVQPKKSFKPDYNSLLWKEIGEFGVVGKFIHTVGAFVTGDKAKAKTWGEAIKNTEKLVEKVGKAYKSSKDGINAEWVKSLLSLEKKSLISESVKDAGRFQQSANGFVEGLKTGASKVNKFNVIATMIADACGNYDEYKTGTISASRAVKETVMETAIDVGKGVLVSGLVTGGLALVGITSAPAVAVGAISVGVIWGADVLCEKISGKKVTELVSDAVLDVAEKVEKTTNEIKKVVKDKVGEAAKEVKNGIQAGWKKITKAFS